MGDMGSSVILNLSCIVVMMLSRCCHDVVTMSPICFSPEAKKEECGFRSGLE